MLSRVAMMACCGVIIISRRGANDEGEEVSCRASCGEMLQSRIDMSTVRADVMDVVDVVDHGGSQNS